MMLEADRAREHAAAWIDAWNRHDLDAVMALYGEPLEFVSPLVRDRLGRADGTIRDRATLRGYFAASLAPGSDLRFDLRSVLAGVASYVMFYMNHRQQLVAETCFPDEGGLIVRCYVHHLRMPLA